MNFEDAVSHVCKRITGLTPMEWLKIIVLSQLAVKMQEALGRGIYN